MLLRTLVSQYLRQAAEKKIYEQVSKEARRRGFSADEEAAESDEESGIRKLPACDVAIMFALGVESGGLVDLMADAVTTRCPAFLEHAGKLNGLNIVIAESGEGRAKAAKATEDVIAIHKPDWIISAGFAGSLREEVRRGQIVMADHVVDEHGEKISVGLKMDPASLKAIKGLLVGRLLTLDHVVTKPDDKRKLAEQHDAIACDLETIAIAEVCAAQHVRFISVRVISDGFNDKLPLEIDHITGQRTIAGKLGAVTGALFRRPSSIKELWQLKADALKASERLAKFLPGILRQLISNKPSDG